MMISKSTTADLLKMFYKLEEFFCQQFKSSKRVFINLEPRLQNRSSNSISRRQRKAAAAAATATTTTAEQQNTSTTSASSKEWSDAHHHRHWQKPLKKVFIIPITFKLTLIIILIFGKKKYLFHRQWD